MKKTLIALLTFLVCLSAFAQRPNKEKLKAYKIAHITEQLDLTAKEAQAFWPIYNEHEDAREKLQEAANITRKKENIEKFTEAEAKVFLDKISKMEEERFKMNKAYQTKLLQVLTAKKVIALMQADRSFRQKMLKEWKNRHRGKDMDRKRN